MKLELSETNWRMDLASRLSTVFLVVAPCAVSVWSQEWAQWGGPHRNFKSDAKGLASSWPQAGPRRLWSRELGDG